MKYSEYQVWYHVYTRVATAMMRFANHDADVVIFKASKIADHALAMFKSVDDTPTIPKSLDIQGLVDRVVKDAKKK
jgi:hypothetical protein